MAPEIGRTQEVAAETWEVELAAQAAVEHAADLPGIPAGQVAQELLARLVEKKRHRQAQNLDHWEEYAPEYLRRVLVWIIHRRRRAIEAFYKANHSRALAFAEAILKNSSEAQDAVSDTCAELLKGKTTPDHFFRALKANARNRLRRLAFELEKLEPIEKVVDPRHLPGEDRMAGGESEEFSLEPASLGLEDRDPLEILIQHEEEDELGKQIVWAKRVAETDRRYWWIRQKKWGQKLGIAASKVRKVSTK